MTEQKMSKNELLGLDAKRTSRRKLFVAAATVIALGGISGYHFWGGEGPKPSYATTAVRQGDLHITVSANGTLSPVRTVSIGSELSGIVSEVFVDVNSPVKEGDVLIALDQAKLKASVNQAKASLSSAKASLAQAKATLVEAKAKMARLQELNRVSQGRLPSRAELDEQNATVLKSEAGVLTAQAAIEDAQATLETKLTDLSKALIKSPVDGVVLARSVEPGYAVAASLQAVELLTVATDLRRLELKVDVDEADVGQVQTGQNAHFTVASYPNKKFAADLTKVAYGAATSTDNVVTYTAYLNVSNPDLALRPGMTATATIETASRKNVLLVPNTALRFKPRLQAAKSGFSIPMGPPHRGQSKGPAKEVSLNQTEREQTVYVIGENGLAQPVRIVTGLTNGRMTEVIAGPLKVGDKIITDQLKGTR